MQYFTILHYKVQSFNIQDDRSKRGLLAKPLKNFQNHLYGQSVFFFAVRAVGRVLRSNKINGLTRGILSTPASDVHWTTENKRHVQSCVVQCCGVVSMFCVVKWVTWHCTRPCMPASKQTKKNTDFPRARSTEFYQFGSTFPSFWCVLLRLSRRLCFLVDTGSCLFVVSCVASYLVIWPTGSSLVSGFGLFSVFTPEWIRAPVFPFSCLFSYFLFLGC